MTMRNEFLIFNVFSGLKAYLEEGDTSHSKRATLGRREERRKRQQERRERREREDAARALEMEKEGKKGEEVEEDRPAIPPREDIQKGEQPEQ